MSADDVDPDRTLSAYGVDSLITVDIRNWIMQTFCAHLGIWEIGGGETTIKTNAQAVVRKSTV